MQEALESAFLNPSIVALIDSTQKPSSEKLRVSEITVSSRTDGQTDMADLSVHPDRHTDGQSEIPAFTRTLGHG